MDGRARRAPTHRPYPPSLRPLHLYKERHAAVLQRGAFVQVGILRTDGQCKKRGNLWNGVMV